MKINSKLTLKTAEWRPWHRSIFYLYCKLWTDYIFYYNLLYFYYIFLVSIIDLEQVNVCSVGDFDLICSYFGYISWEASVTIFCFCHKVVFCDGLLALSAVCENLISVSVAVKENSFLKDTLSKEKLCISSLLNIPECHGVET